MQAYVMIGIAIIWFAWLLFAGSRTRRRHKEELSSLVRETNALLDISRDAVMVAQILRPRVTVSERISHAASWNPIFPEWGLVPGTGRQSRTPEFDERVARLMATKLVEHGRGSATLDFAMPHRARFRVFDDSGVKVDDLALFAKSDALFALASFRERLEETPSASALKPASQGPLESADSRSMAHTA